MKRDIRSYDFVLMYDVTIGYVWHEADLEVDGISRAETSLHLRDSIFCMTIKDIEVTYSVMAEEGPCHRTMEFPHFTLFILVCC